MWWIADLLADWWLRQCRHEDSHVAADLLEGRCPGTEVKYCRRCGAVKIAHEASARPRADWQKRVGEWRRPLPLWYALTGD